MAEKQISGLDQANSVARGDFLVIDSTVGSSAVTAKITVQQLVLDMVYPIGSVYITASSKSPIELFGGVWERVASGRCLWGSPNGSGAGSEIEAGLPNIQGSLSYEGGYPSNASGAFSGSDSAVVRATASSTKKGYTNLSFSASSSSAIYGKSSTVQPPAYVVNMWERKS